MTQPRSGMSPRPTGPPYLVVVGQQPVHIGHVLARQLLQHQRPIGREQQPVTAACPARGAPGQGHLGGTRGGDRWPGARGQPGGPPQSAPPTHLVVLVVDAKALAKVTEHLGTVFLELEVAGQVLPEFGGVRGEFLGVPRCGMLPLHPLPRAAHLLNR